MNGRRGCRAATADNELAAAVHGFAGDRGTRATDGRSAVDLVSGRRPPFETVSVPPDEMVAAKSWPPLLTVRKPPLSMVAAETLPPFKTRSVLPEVSVYADVVEVVTDVVVMAGYSDRRKADTVVDWTSVRPKRSLLHRMVGACLTMRGMTN